MSSNADATRPADKCARCKRRLKPGDPATRRADLGGIVCAKCARRPVRSAR